MWSSFRHHPLVKFLASLKLAVVVIALMTVMMVWGTLADAEHGPEYAKTAVYFSPFFLGVEIMLFLNILFAALVRLPPQKRLAGFYVVHSGLLLILAGAAVTAFFGLDGSLELVPGEAARYVRVERPHLHAIASTPASTEAKPYARAMPRVAGEYAAPGKTFMTAGEYEIRLKRYFPFAAAKSSWVDDAPGTPPSMTLWITLANENMSQPLTLSGTSLETSRAELGALTLELVPEMASDCFAAAVADAKAKYLYASRDKCVALKGVTANPFSIDGVTFRKTKDEPFLKIVVNDGERDFNFYPGMTAFPIGDDIRILEKAGARFVDLEAARKSAHVLFFADRKFGAGKGKEWKFSETAQGSENSLPWMGFSMSLDRVIHARHEKTEWRYEPPGKGEEAARGRAALVGIVARAGAETEAWIDDSRPANVTLPDGTLLRLLIGPELKRLPFDIELSHFNMDTVPGTQDPASYESVVVVKSGSSSSHERIFMNNPLKRDGFTLYQASYFQLDNGSFGSVLSVNRDPGRGLKYAGSLLLVLGCVAHYGLRSRSTGSSARVAPQSLMEDAGCET